MPFWNALGNTLKDIGAGLPIVGGLIQSGINARVARENTDKTIAANKALAEYQYSKDLEMWNRGNAYNSPLAQMDRLKAAGLNPNMVYGSGSAAGMAAGQLPKYNAPTVSYNYEPPVDIPSTIAQFQNFRIGNAQIRNTEEQAQQRAFQNQVLGDPDYIWGKQQLPSWQSWAVRQGYWNAAQLNQQRRELFPSQLQAVQGQARKVGLENLRIMSATKNLDLKNDYFAAEAISRLFGGMVGAGATALRALKSSPKGALGKGTLGTPNLNKRLKALEMGSYYGSQRYK